DVPVVGDTVEERQRLRETIHRTLGRSGVLRAGRVDPTIEDALVVLARAPFVLTATGDVDRAPLLARACSDGRDAVLARQHGNHLAVGLVRPTAVVPAIVDLLPDIPPGRGASLTMPAAQHQPPSRDEDDYDPLAAARDRPTAGGSERAVARIFGRPRLGFGALTASVRQAAPGGEQRWHRLGQLTWWDIQQENGAGPGRWFTTTSGDPPQLSLHPGDNARLAGYLQQLVGPHLP
ncbi:MAG: ESX secretion-associated protein EspG, partial [Thermocrispum sp.]